MLALPAGPPRRKRLTPVLLDVVDGASIAETDAIVDGLTARTPRTRFLVGRQARMEALVALLPDRLRDRLIARYLGL